VRPFVVTFWRHAKVRVPDHSLGRARAGHFDQLAVGDSGDDSRACAAAVSGSSRSRSRR